LKLIDVLLQNVPADLISLGCKAETPLVAAYRSAKHMEPDRSILKLIKGYLLQSIFPYISRQFLSFPEKACHKQTLALEKNNKQTSTGCKGTLSRASGRSAIGT
jgi:hypothetical protein